MDDKIGCKLCGARVHAISIHLTKVHDESSATPCTLAEYKARFADAPVFSQKALEKLAEKRAGHAAEPMSEKEPMSKLFKLESSPSVRKAGGGEIMITTCTQEGYDNLIPKYKDSYVYNIDILKSILMAFEIAEPVYIFGHAGLGKTSIIKQICAATRRRLVRLQHTVNTQETDITGLWTVAKEVHGDTVINVTKFQPGPLALCMINGWTFVADEFDRAPPSVVSVYNAILEGEGEPLHIPDAPEEFRYIHPHPDFRFAATGNTNGSGDQSGLYQATMTQDAATIERFSVCIHVNYMPAKQESAVIRGASRIKPADSDRIVSFAAKIREKFPSDLSLTVGPRTLIKIAKIGVLRGSFAKGIELCFANRLPLDEKKAVMDLAQREFGETVHVESDVDGFSAAAAGF